MLAGNFGGAQMYLRTYAMRAVLAAPWVPEAFSCLAGAWELISLLSQSEELTYQPDTVLAVYLAFNCERRRWRHRV